MAVPASADTFYGLSWTSIADYFNFNWSTFETETVHGERTGSGVLQLSSMPDGTWAFTFDGVGGSGFGQTIDAEIILPGAISFPIPPDVPVGGSPSQFGQGILLIDNSITGEDLVVGYFEGTSPHCLNDCWSVEFFGSGTQIAEASEPLSAGLLALGLAAAAALRRRRRGERR